MGKREVRHLFNRRIALFEDEVSYGNHYRKFLRKFLSGLKKDVLEAM